MDLSIIIPTLNESSKISADIQSAARYLSEENLLAEIIIVDDGSTDDTCEIAKNAPVEQPVELRIFQSTQHHGKGFALRKGFAQSRGTYAMFADSGSNVPWHFIGTGLQLIKSGECDIVHGSRHLPESEISKDQTWKRKLTSRIFRILMRRTMGIPAVFSDTQCGFKIYRDVVAKELYSEAVSNGFMIDIEIIRLALRRSFRIREIPIEWHCDSDSRLSLRTNFLNIYREWRLLRKQFK